MILTYLYSLINQIAKKKTLKKIGNRYKTEHQDCKGIRSKKDCKGAKQTNITTWSLQRK
jgi:hypothetical protein